MYGGPLESGHGDLDFLFKLDHVWPNLQRYPGWLLQTETPIVLLALAAPFLVRASSSPTRTERCDIDTTPLGWRPSLWLLLFATTVFACYIPYEVFDAWWYLRFLLPAYPAILVLTATALNVLSERWLPRWRIAGLVVAVAVAFFMVRVAVDRGTFGLREFEQRFRLAGEYVATHLPANAAIITGQESGSVRFYSVRLTLFWRELPSDSLDRALEFLRAEGYRPYLLLEQWEQRDFVQKFGSTSRAGELSWPPIVDINHEVRMYDPADYARYRAGELVRTDRVWARKK
jgi:hypothetical protein